MYANITASPADLKVQLQAFMDQHIYPNETVYHDQLNSMADRFQTVPLIDRKSTRLNSSHDQISYAVFCLKKKKNNTHTHTI